MARNDIAVLPQWQSDYDLEGTNLVVLNANFEDATKYRVRNIDRAVFLAAEAIIFGKFKDDYTIGPNWKRIVDALIMSKSNFS